jgi:DNA repair protein RecO (recombination protein O)
MSVFSTPAILLHRLDYGDFDLILTFLSLDRGKISLIAKSAKRSTKRFAGILELFSLIEVVGSISKGRGLPVLQEAVLHSPFSAIRADINKTAYASYWCELINKWVEENRQQAQLYHLLRHVLGQLDSGAASAAELSILFQMRLLNLSGHSPNLRQCARCQKHLTFQRAGLCVIAVLQAPAVASGCQRGRLNSLTGLKAGISRKHPGCDLALRP